MGWDKASAISNLAISHVAAARIHYMLQINSLSLSRTMSYESQRRSHHKIPYVQKRHSMQW